MAESIPSSLVQIYAILISGNRSASSLVSIIVSIATISLATTTICFDYDLDPERRARVPDFYGYIPSSSGKRTVVFFSMFLFTACHVAVRILGIALLAVVSPMITVAVLGGDMAFFLLFKFVRNDLRYSYLMYGWLSWFASFITRIFAKLMVDFTVMVQLRHPQEIGGLYWITCLLLGQSTSFVVVYLYSLRPTADATISSNDLWALVGALEACFVVFFAVFVGSIAAKFRVTFFSTITGKKFGIKAFHEATTDRVKMNILGSHPSYYKSIRGEVEQWVRDNYATWNEEKPDWFTERKKRTIPIDMIPKSEAYETESEKGICAIE